MLAKTESIALIGAEARLVQVEVHVSTGMPRFMVVGLPAKSVREAEQRTRSALISSGYEWPSARIVANLAPGGLPKEGTHFDLPIALGVLAGDERLQRALLNEWVCIGELALDGALRPVRGTLAAAMTCRGTGRRGLICPSGNAPEAALVDGIEVAPVSSLDECVRFLRGEWPPPNVEPPAVTPEVVIDDMAEIRGHPGAKRAAEIAAAGGHNLLLVGPPGSGKTMLASRIAGILPEMSMDESLEVTRIHSVAGLLTERPSLIRSRPFRTPHHNISMPGLIGGGSMLPRPGEITLAHRGVLFLDEVALFRPEALESLRGPSEQGVVRIARSAGSISFPCRFALIAAMNPCPCGYLGDSRRACACSEARLGNYQARLSGPFLDRFDMQVAMPRLTKRELVGVSEGESSRAIRTRVERARQLQRERYGAPMKTNAGARRSELRQNLEMSRQGRAILELAVESLMLSGRGLDRVLRVARTIADLEGARELGEAHIAESLSYRSPECDSGAAA